MAKEKNHGCPHCERKFSTLQGVADHEHMVHGSDTNMGALIKPKPWKNREGHMDPHSKKPPPLDPNSTEPDWNHECEVCGQTPVVPVTGLCGPCTFGESSTAGGNW